MNQQNRISAKEENCSQYRPEAGNLQMTEEVGFHYFTFEGVGSWEVYNL